MEGGSNDRINGVRGREAMHLIRKGQIWWLPKGNVVPAKRPILIVQQHADDAIGSEGNRQIRIAVAVEIGRYKVGRQP